jgi:hypothetical protein
MSLEMMNPKEIKIHPTFAALFPIKADLLRRIEANMREEGYDESQPVLLARWKGQEESVCIDGHTRLTAAVNAGIEIIPVFVRQFDDEPKALTRSILGRVNRQGSTLTDAEMFRIIRLLHNVNSEVGGGHAEFSGLSWVKNIARLLRSSSQKVEKALTVHERGAPAMVRTVEERKMSIHKAAQEIERLRRLPPPLFPDLPKWLLTSLTESIPQQA